MTKICRRCRYTQQKATWTCRSCGALCCEHMCTLKIFDAKTGEKTASCCKRSEP